ncbi:GNAT family N-acetyltransferase [Paenalkalicoccus suaedae]|uniref:GNAT family N-acetyltransferase n=1 Tax=Paenalkalicoccus suaedae TaxID=2592382 RepID=A0A859F9P8_9BACI|nr:N-acetyltransferase [Paenalkalicoccus suaedae]QKS69903.1 GNAT family N-acetyltransferase [Paenalkalicoccus suaedae]
MIAHIQAPQRADELAQFLARMNNDLQMHIGFCGENPDEIYDQLTNDFSDLPWQTSFVVAYEDDRIVAAIGLDVDLERGYADVWGPFTETKDMTLSKKIWEELTSGLDKVKKYSFFVNEENAFAQRFAEEVGGAYKGMDYVLLLHKEDDIRAEADEVAAFNTAFAEDFTSVHTDAFPDTYYNAETILSRLNETNQLHMLVRDDALAGYVYAEANPEHGEGTIEYIAVSPDSRKQGIGKQLLAKGCQALFSHEGVSETSICVGTDNKAAISLYQAVGFKVKYKLKSYLVTV